MISLDKIERLGKTLAVVTAIVSIASFALSEYRQAVIAEKNYQSSLAKAEVLDVFRVAGKPLSYDQALAEFHKRIVNHENASIDTAKDSSFTRVLNELLATNALQMRPDDKYEVPVLPDVDQFLANATSMMDDAEASEYRFKENQTENFLMNALRHASEPLERMELVEAASDRFGLDQKRTGELIDIQVKIGVLFVDVSNKVVGMKSRSLTPARIEEN